nr:putative ribonuclease H-like domain-containing protein [Tanacetum cinerariifolium]
MTKHTKEQCFEIVGYPDWWVGNKKGKSGKATAAVGSQETIDIGNGNNTHQKGIGVEKYPSNPSSQNSTLLFKNPQEELETPSTSWEVNMATSGKKNDSWIFDCDATDTMTYEISDICAMSKPQKSHIRTGKIIGHGTERQGLYYVDEIVTQQGTVILAHGSTDREAWLWHRRLGHLSTSYLHHLFPKLFPTNKVLNCETCVLAKNHRHTFKSNATKGEKEYNDALSWLKWMSSSEETSHTSLPQSTDPGNSTINDDLSILMSKKFDANLGSRSEMIETGIPCLVTTSFWKRIRLKRDKSEQNRIKTGQKGKRGEARKSQDQSQWIEQEKPKKTQKEWSKTQTRSKSY